MRGSARAVHARLPARCSGADRTLRPARAARRATARAEGLAAWFLQKQAEFHRALTLAFREAASDRGGILTLMGLPSPMACPRHRPGHGKAVISGYIVANESALKRGVALAFGAAAVQALIALGVVLVIAKVVAARRGMSIARW